MKCRTCKGSDLYKFIDLGYHPPSDQFRKKEQLNDPVTYFPLEVFMCNTCGLAQLGHVVDPEILYQDNYPYESSTTQTGKRHFHDFAKSVKNDFKFSDGDLAVDIGSNVGVLLEGFKDAGMDIMGVDPAPNICEIANRRGIPTINDFYGENAAREILKSHGKAKVITGTNVFAHIDDLYTLMDAIKLLLDEDKGIFVIEAPHFLHLLQSLEYDTIYHEHLSYIAVEPLIGFFANFDMEIVKIEQKDIHGGSIRIFVSGVNNYPADSSVQKLIDMEKEHNIRESETLYKFNKDVQQNRTDLTNLLNKLKNEGKKIVGVSAPAKGMTLLNYCKIGRETLDYITEKSKLKIGLHTPGDHIPIYPDSKLLEDQPDYALLLAWNFSKEIINNLSEYREKGGKFIIPIPKPIIVE